jgi:hypothetical protein
MEEALYKDSCVAIISLLAISSSLAYYLESQVGSLIQACGTPFGCRNMAYFNISDSIPKHNKGNLPRIYQSLYLHKALNPKSIPEILQN